jgi:hypothetical protein
MEVPSPVRLLRTNPYTHKERSSVVFQSKSSPFDRKEEWVGGVVSWNESGGREPFTRTGVQLVWLSLLLSNPVTSPNFRQKKY